MFELNGWEEGGGAHSIDIKKRDGRGSGTMVGGGAKKFERVQRKNNFESEVPL